jgi:hypothetical protein
MALEVISGIRHSLPRFFSLRNVAGGGVLERTRSSIIALFGVIVAIGLTLVGIAANQGWPELVSVPLPWTPTERIGEARAVGETASPVVNAGAPRGGAMRGSRRDSGGLSPDTPTASQGQPGGGAPGAQSPVAVAPDSPPVPVGAAPPASQAPTGQSSPPTAGAPPQAHPEPVPTSPPVESPAPVGSPSEGGKASGPTGPSGNGNGKAKGHEGSSGNGKAKGHEKSVGSPAQAPTVPAPADPPEPPVAEEPDQPVDGGGSGKGKGHAYGHES